MLLLKRLKKVLFYNPTTGKWINKINRSGNGSLKGKFAGHLASSGYYVIKVDNVLYSSSMLAWFYVTGKWSKFLIDHKDRNKQNDCWYNLREVSYQGSCQNRGNFKNNTSGVKGVSWFKRVGKWQAVITVNYKKKGLGYYINFDNAVCARLAAEQCLDWLGNDNSPAYHHVKKMQEVTHCL